MTQPVVQLVEELTEREKALLGEGHRLLPLSVNSSGLSTGVMAKQGQGILYGFTVYNQGSAQFILVMTPDTYTTAGATPVLCFPIPGASTMAVNFGDHGKAFRQGIAVVNSTTDTTLTAGTANCMFDVQYI